MPRGESEGATTPGTATEQGLSPTGSPVSARAAAFNPFEGPYQVDPAEALRWSREDEPVFCSPELGYWVVSRYDDVKAVFRDNILFSPAIALEKITPAPPECDKIARRVPRLTGVRPKPMAMASPSTQKASSPASTTSLASASRATLTGVVK